MLIVAVAVFAIAALLGVLMAVDAFKGVGSSRLSRWSHAGFVLLGSVLVILAALGGDHRVWINIGLAVVIIPLGVWLCYKRFRGIHPKALLVIHGGLAVVCFLILAYYTFDPR